MILLERVIYVDVLISLNLFVNYFMLLAVSKFLYLHPKKKRIIIGSILGSIYSLYIFIPKQSMMISFLAKIFMAVSIVAVAFGKKTNFMKSLICFCLVNFSFSGLILAMWLSFKPKGMAFNNGIVYFNISPLVLIISTLISYFILEYANKYLGKHICKRDFCRVSFRINEKELNFDAFLDTGNSLKEPFSCLPVIIAKKDDIKSVIPFDIDMKNENLISDLSNKLNINFRLIPFSGLSHSGFIVGFKPNFVNIKTSTGKFFDKEAYIGICCDKNFEHSLVGIDILDS